MKKIASIMCDGGGKADYRRNIYLKGGRLICDGNDITPRTDKYPRGQAGYEEAAQDIEAMYAGNFWGLEWAEA